VFSSRKITLYSAPRRAYGVRHGHYCYDTPYATGLALPTRAYGGSGWASELALDECGPVAPPPPPPARRLPWHAPLALPRAPPSSRTIEMSLHNLHPRARRPGGSGCLAAGGDGGSVKFLYSLYCMDKAREGGGRHGGGRAATFLGGKVVLAARSPGRRL
jgi:hypothetical protein